MKSFKMSRTNYVILLPPSEGKNKGGDIIYSDVKNKNSFMDIHLNREYIYQDLLDVIESSDEKTLEKVFDLKGNNLKEAIENTKVLDQNQTLSSIDRYSGVMFKSIDYLSLNEDQKENFNSSVLFIDGMFGLLKPQDKIPNYKLKITSKIGSLNITKYWKENLKQLFNKEFNEKLIIDILPEAHRKVVNFSKSKEHLSVIFYVKKGDKVKQAGHESKVLKGEIIRYILEKDKVDKEYIKNFKHSLGYDYCEELSGDNLVAFLKEE